jgi:hypothetical protein
MKKYRKKRQVSEFMDYRVIIIGCGPAGIFTALTLAENGIGGVILFDKGNELEKRERNSAKDVLCGWGGAGAFSDGKLNISTEVGGYLSEFLDKNDLVRLLKNTDEVFVNHGAPDRVFGNSRRARIHSNSYPSYRHGKLPACVKRHEESP